MKLSFLPLYPYNLSFTVIMIVTLIFAVNVSVTEGNICDSCVNKTVIVTWVGCVLKTESVT